METNSIEERATQDANERVSTTLDKFGHWLSHRDAYIRVATEQDCIARNEERERCIRIAKKVCCAYCKHSIEGCSQDEKDCPQIRQIRLDIMEGGEV